MIKTMINDTYNLVRRELEQARQQQQMQDAMYQGVQQGQHGGNQGGMMGGMIGLRQPLEGNASHDATVMREYRLRKPGGRTGSYGAQTVSSSYGDTGAATGSYAAQPGYQAAGPASTAGAPAPVSQFPHAFGPVFPPDYGSHAGGSAVQGATRFSPPGASTTLQGGLASGHSSTGSAGSTAPVRPASAPQSQRGAHPPQKK